MRPVLAMLASFALVTWVDERSAQAEEQEVETADGLEACEVFRERNSRELAGWERQQPPTPYRYPREKTILFAPWQAVIDNLGRSGSLLLATILPHVGAQYRGDAPAAYVGWPWSFAVGPMHSCSRKKGMFIVHGHRGHRLMFEPALATNRSGTGFSIRPGYRFIWHPTSWVVGPGLGVGSTLELVGMSEPFRYSVGPEAIAHFGTCCRSSYVTLTFRYDHYFAGTHRDIVGASLGYTFF